MEFYHPDIKGLIRGIAEEVAYNDSNGDFHNWTIAEGIFYSSIARFCGEVSVRGYSQKFVKFVHESISARARKLANENLSNDQDTNWLTAQKDWAVEIYLMDVAEKERKVKIQSLESQINSELNPLKNYQNI